MAVKKGAGGKPEKYDVTNGQYCKSPEKLKEDLILQYLFDLGEKEEFPLPQFGVFDEEYAYSYAVCYMRQRSIKNYSINDSKIKDYLVKYRLEGNDKSQFFAHFGYTERNWQKLKSEIINGTDFKQIFYDKYDEWGLHIYLKTAIPSLLDGRNITFFSCWIVDNDETIRFVTVDLKRKKGNGYGSN